MAILEKLFLILIFIFPLGQVLKFQLGNNVSFLLNDIVVLIIGFIFLSLIYKKKIKLKSSNLDKPIILFFLSLIISLSLATFWLKPNELLVSLLYLLRLVSYFLLFYVVRGFNRKYIEKLPRYLIISGGLFLIIGFLQYFLYNDLRNLFYLGWDEHLYRLFSTFFDPNFTGTFLVIYSAFLFSYFKYKVKKNNLNKTLYFSLILLSFLGVFLTYSRSALLAMLILSGLTLFLINKRKIFIAVLLASLLIVFLVPKSFQTEGTNLLRVASIDARLASFDNGIRIFKDNLIFGVGFNAYRYTQIRYGFVDSRNLSSNSGAGTDNSFLFIAGTAGTIGLISFIYLLYTILMTANQKRSKSFIHLSVFLSVVGVLFASLFINAFFYVFILEWILIQIGIMENN